MIESLHIKNFRGIQDGKIDRFSKINLLVGPNNSGKSAVLETIYLTNSASADARLELAETYFEINISSTDLLGDDPLERVCARHNKIPQDAEQKEIITKHPQDKSNVEFRIHTEKATVKVGLISGSGFSLRRGSGTKHQTLIQTNRPLFGSVVGEDLEIDDSKNTRFVYFWEAGLTHQQFGEATWLVKGKVSPSQKTLFYDVRNTLNHLPFEFFRKMLNRIPGWTHKIAKSFERIFHLKQKFNVTFLQLQHDLSLTQGFIAPEDKIALTIDDYGDGARSAFKLLTPLIALSELATADEPGVFLWEEPELFQNPQSLGRFLAEVIELIKDKPIQLFIATHSIEVVAQFVRLVNEQAIKEDDLLAIRLNLQDGQLSSSAFNHQDIQDWTAMHLDLRVPDGKVDSPLKFQLAEATTDGE